MVARKSRRRQPARDADKQQVTTIPTIPLPLPTTARDRAERSRAVAASLVVAALIAAALFGRLCYLAKPFDHDARLFIYLGKLVCDGGRFGHDVIDNKFPTVGLMTSVFWRALGLAWPAYVLAQTIMAVGGALLLGRIARRHFYPTAALPTTVFAIVFLNFSIAVFGGFQLETMQTFFAILAAGAAMEALRRPDARDGFVVGLAAGCAMMFKPTGGAVLGAFALATVIRFAREPKTVAKLGISAACGLAIPAAITLLYLVRTDTLRDMPELYRQIARYASETPVTWVDLLKPVVVVGMLGFPLLIRGWIHRTDRIVSEGPMSRQAAVFVSVWFVLELAGAVAQRRMCGYHFLPIAAPAALLYGMIPRRPRLVPVVTALLPIVLLSTLGAARVIHEFYPSPSRLRASDYLIAHTEPNNTVWQDSYARLLLETGLRPGSRVPLTYLFFNSDDAPRQYSAIMLHDFDIRRPKYILLPQDLQGWLDEKDHKASSEPGYAVRRANYRAAWWSILHYVQSHYSPEVDIDGETLYRRNDSPR
jgi:hypothetical protein